jgi:hypothetical protein
MRTSNSRKEINKISEREVTLNVSQAVRVLALLGTSRNAIQRHN